MSMSGEVTRVREHIRGAETLLDEALVDHLDDARRAMRVLLREELGRYRAAGCFPKNRDFPGQMLPHFIDAEGTRCAMAHLMELGGAGELVAEIARERNNAYVAELADDPRVTAWLDAAGLTVAEAARIQPSYGPIPVAAAYCICALASGNGAPGSATSGAWEGTVVTAPHPAQLNVDAVYGATGSLALGTHVPVQNSTPVSVGQRLLVAGTYGDGGLTPQKPVSALDSTSLLGDRCYLDTGLDPGSMFPTAARTLGPLSESEALSVVDMTPSGCLAFLKAIDPCWTEQFAACTYAARLGQPARVSPGSNPFPSDDAGAGAQDAGAQDAGAQDAGATPPERRPQPTADAGPSSPAQADSTRTSGGCSDAGAAPGSASLLLGVIGALVARRKSKRRDRSIPA
jgi:hypothetical protein